MRFKKTLSLLSVFLLGAGALEAQTATGARDTLALAQPPAAAGEAEAEIFMSAIQAIAQLHQTPFSDSTLWARALDGLIESLEDPYASVFTPEEVAAFDEDNTGNYAGIGVQITELNDRVTVTAVFRATPADRAGMQVGDIIVGVGEHDASEWGSDMVADSVRGPVGTSVDVTVRREGYAGPIAFPLVRDQVHVPAVTADHIGDDVLYIGMDRVARGAAQEMDSVLRQFHASSGIVLDLRRNPGGYLDESLMLADLFLQPGARLASTRSRDPRSPTQEFYEESWNARMRPRVPDTPVVILVDEYTASAAEILAGALQDYDRALILGQRTFGKGVVQTVLELPYGRRLRLTTGSWYTPLGRSLHRTRDGSGRPVVAADDSLQTILSSQGRTLVATGGIFPDLEVRADTLKLSERELLSRAAELQIPLPLRVAEFGFAEAQVLRENGESPRLRPEAFDAFLLALEDEGMPADLLADAETRDYLSWRARISIADRMDRLGEAALVRMERDPVLMQALSLLSENGTQSELFAAAEELSQAEVAMGGDRPVGRGGPSR